MSDPAVIQLEGSMPGMFAHIRMKVERWSYHFEVSYAAMPMDLVAAGLVDPAMIERIFSSKPGPMFDSNGKRFSFGWSPKYRSARRVWESGEPVTFIRFPRSDAEAMEMPGMHAMFPHGLPQADPNEARRRRIVEDEIRTRTEVVRTRAIGRLQRVVSWTVVGSIITPDWTQIMAQ